MTPAGAWTAKQLAEWGVRWPPEHGWRERLRVEWEQSQSSEIQQHPKDRVKLDLLASDADLPEEIRASYTMRRYAHCVLTEKHQQTQISAPEIGCMICGSTYEKVVITDGREYDGGPLRVVRFCSAEHAAQGGYSWAGR